MWINKEKITIQDENIRVTFLVDEKTRLMRVNICILNDEGNVQRVESRPNLTPAFSTFHEKYNVLIAILLYVIAGLKRGSNLKQLADDVSFITPTNYKNFMEQVA